MNSTINLLRPKVREVRDYSQDNRIRQKYTVDYVQRSPRESAAIDYSLLKNKNSEMFKSKAKDRSDFESIKVRSRNRNLLNKWYLKYLTLCRDSNFGSIIKLEKKNDIMYYSFDFYEDEGKH